MEQSYVGTYYLLLMEGGETRGVASNVSCFGVVKLDI